MRVPPAKTPKKGIPSVWYFLVTLRCNLGCIHCSIREILNKYPGEATLDQIRRAFSKIPLEGTSFLISGGEPFLRTDLADIVRFLKEEKSVESISLETNGIVAPRKMLEDVISSGVDYFYVSVDGFPDAYEKIRGRREYFYKAIDTIETAIDLGALYTFAITTINKFNANSIDEFVTFLIKDVGVSGVRILLIEEVGGGKELGEDIVDKLFFINKIVNLYRKFGRNKIAYFLPLSVVPPGMREKVFCGIGSYAVGVLPDLRLTLCYRSISFATERTLLDSSLDELLKASFIKMARSVSISETYGGVCGACRLNELCCGACRIAAYDILGSFDGPYPLCQALYEQGVFPKEYLTGFNLGR